MLQCSGHRGLKIGVRITPTPACRCPRPEQRRFWPGKLGRDRATACLKAQPQTAADIPGASINSTNGVTPRAWKMIGVHQTMDNAVPAAPNPRAAQMRGNPLKTVATSGIDKVPTQSCNTSNLAVADRLWASLPPWSRTDFGQVALSSQIRRSPFPGTIVLGPFLLALGLRLGLRSNLPASWSR
jgi:hypothetical protein